MSRASEANSEKIERLEKLVMSLCQRIDSISGGDEIDDETNVSTVSDMVSKPRTFTEINSLQNSVSNLYTGRLQSRLRELNKLHDANEDFEKTGVLDLPSDMIDQLDLWEKYMELLNQYCNDVEDLLSRDTQ